MLARREYSMHELRQKLDALPGADAEVVQSVLEHLVQKGLQSDLRCIEHCLRHLRSKGWGHGRLQAELERRGLDAKLLDNLPQPDWDALATEQVGKRFKRIARNEIEYRQQARHLYNRGFTEEQIQRALGEPPLE